MQGIESMSARHAESEVGRIYPKICTLLAEKPEG